jgi:hypothetical protein
MRCPFGVWSRLASGAGIKSRRISQSTLKELVMSNETNFARFNIHLKASSDLEATVASLQELLYNAALWAGADDPEVFFESEKSIVGVSVELEEGTMMVLETGAVLGQCQLAFENADFAEATLANWFSIVDSDGNVIESPY